MLQYGGMETSQIEPLQRMAIAIALAEITARDSGVKKRKRLYGISTGCFETPYQSLNFFGVSL